MTLPTAQTTALRHARWTAAPVGKWPQVLRSLFAAGARVVMAEPDSVELTAWLPAVRAARLVPAMLCHPETLTDEQLRSWSGLGPLLIVLAATPTTAPSAWQAARARLASLRDPHLRVALLAVPVCHRGALVADVVLAGPSAADRRCARCPAAGACPGPDSPQQPVQPLPMPISNQFDLIQTAATTVAPDRVRLADGRVFACDSMTWQRADVQETVRREQLYLDISDKPRLDDFASDLRLLRCEQDGAWHVRPQQPFAAEEALLRQHLAALRGLIVDIGAGPIRYIAELRAAMRQGTLQYLAVEPDPQHLARARAALPEGRMVQGTGEHLPLLDGCADAVLMLRSVNHLRDLRAGICEALRVLRPGGSLLMVDNVAFGLLRTPAQQARAHAISVQETPFEHYRNDDATDIVAILGAEFARAIKVIAVHPVLPGGSNQWLVLVRRTC